MAARSSTGTRTKPRLKKSRLKTRQSKTTKTKPPKLRSKAAATAAAAASVERIHVWVLSWFRRVKGRSVRGTQSLISLHYDDDADLGHFTDSFNKAFHGGVTTPEIKAAFQIDGATIAGLVHFLSQKIGIRTAVSDELLRTASTFAATAESVTSYQQIKKWVLSWFKRVKGRVVDVGETLRGLRYDDDADLGYFTDSFNDALHSALTTPEIRFEFEVKDATVGGLIDFLSSRVP